MKWFKHDTDAHKSEKLLQIIDAEGLEWYARWFILLEAIASKMDKTERCSLELPVKDWCKLLRVQPKRLIMFLEIYGNILEISWEVSEKFSENFSTRVGKLSGNFSTQVGKLLKISVPKLLEKRDNHTKHLQVTCKKLVSKSKDIRDKRKEKRIIPPEIPNGISVPHELSLAVETWNTLKAKSWPLVRKITPPLPARFASATKIGDFDLEKIILRAKQSDFLAEKKFVTLLWLVTRSDKTGNLNSHDILDGRYDNKKINKPKAGNLRESDIEF